MMAIGPRIDELWSDEGCSWQVRLDGGKWWTVVLEWWTDRDCPHSANYMTLTWDFYDESLRTALADAVDWLEALAVWRPCPECDGQGSWNGEACGACGATGLDGGIHSSGDGGCLDCGLHETTHPNNGCVGRYAE